MHLWQCLPHMPFDVTSDSECLNILSLCSLFVWIGPCCNFVLGFCTAGPGQLFIFKLGSSEQARQQLKIEQTQHSGHAMTEAKSPTACVCVLSRLPRDGNWGSSAFLPAALALHCDGLKDFYLALFCMAAVTLSQETEALSKEGIHCPLSINSPSLGTLWHPFSEMCCAVWETCA